MQTTRRKFLQASAVASAVWASPGSVSGTPTAEVLDAYQIANRHLFSRSVPGPDFFEGMLLGNGDIGVCVTSRPDALNVHLGKNDSWDIRVSEDFCKDVLPFKHLLELWKRADEEAKRQGKPGMEFIETNIDFFREYTEKTSSSYAKSWPRPWPCGTVRICWDPRWVHFRRQDLDPSNGLLMIRLRVTSLTGSPRDLSLSCFIDWDTGLLSVSTDGPAPFSSVSYYPELDDGTYLPPPEIDGKIQSDGENSSAEFSCFQVFPATASTQQHTNSSRSDKDRSFALYARAGGSWEIEGLEESRAQLDRRKTGVKETYEGFEEPPKDSPRILLRSAKEQPLRLQLAIVTPRDHADNANAARKLVNRLCEVPVERIQKQPLKNGSISGPVLP